MELILGVGLLCIGALLFSVIFIAARNPNPSAWFSEFMIAAVYVPFQIILVVVGTVLIFFFFLAIKKAGITTGIELMEDGVAIAMVVGTILLIKALGIKKRLARFSDISSSQQPA